MISLISIVPLSSASPAVHAESEVLPRAMLTIVMSSFTVTSPLPSQSPTQGNGVGVIATVAVALAVGVGVAAGAPIYFTYCVVCRVWVCASYDSSLNGTAVPSLLITPALQMNAAPRSVAEQTVYVSNPPVPRV